VYWQAWSLLLIFKQDHEVSMHKNWIEENSKLSSNLYSFKKRSSLPVNQPILTSNCFAQLINLQDPITPWSESARELYRLSDRRLPEKLMPTFEDRGCHVQRDGSLRPYSQFLDQSRYFLFKQRFVTWIPNSAYVYFVPLRK
jgi:hypothetical protein